MGAPNTTAMSSPESISLREGMLLALAGKAEAASLEKAVVQQRQTGGLLSTALLMAGIPADAVRAALSAASGLPVAPLEALRKPDPTLAQMSKSNGWRQIIAAPFARMGAQLHIAFANPSVLSTPAAAALPAHQAFVALEPDIAQSLATLNQAAPLTAVSATTAAPLTTMAARLANGAAPQPTGPLPQATGPLPPATAPVPFATAPLAEPTLSPASTTLPAAPFASGPGQGERMGEYLLERELGSGGMAVVHLAKEVRSERRVALKLMNTAFAKDPQFIARFVQEAKASAGLRHPNIVEVFAYGDEKGQPFIASEWVDGLTLDTLLDRVGVLPLPVALEIFAQALEAVAYAHERGIVHRDLKPANLLLSKTGWVKLADFGIAKTAQSAALTQTGATLGTPAYMSPEQAAGRATDGRSDLFSAGVMLYQMVSGINPHQGDDPMSCLTKLLEPRTAPIESRTLDTPPAVAQLIDRLLERDVQKRPANAREVLNTLAPLLSPIRSRHPGLLAQFLENPAGTAAALKRQQAAQLSAEARGLLSGGLASRRKAAFAFYRACKLMPDDAALRATFQELLASEGLVAAASVNPKVMQLEEELKKNQTPELLQQLGALYRQERNIFRASEVLTQYLALRPGDNQVRGMLETLRGDRAMPQAATAPTAAAASAPVASPTGESTGSLMAGVLSDFFAYLKDPSRRLYVLGVCLVLAAWAGHSGYKRYQQKQLDAEAAVKKARLDEERRIALERNRALAEEAQRNYAAKAEEALREAQRQKEAEEAREWQEQRAKEREREARGEEQRKLRPSPVPLPTPGL